jgi:LysM repeat protein
LNREEYEQIKIRIISPICAGVLRAKTPAGKTFTIELRLGTGRAPQPSTRAETMNNPNPLIPQGSFSKHSRGNPNVRIAVFTIVAIHAVFFGGLLIQGCKRDYDTPHVDPEPTNNISNYLPALNPDYYSEFTELPAPAPTPPPTPQANVRRDPVAPPGFERGPTGDPGVQGRPEPSAPGSFINPPPAIREREPAFTRAPELPAPPPRAMEAREHTIVRGDTFSTIGSAYGVSAAAIADANPGVDPRRLQVGRKLTIPAASSSPAPAANRGGGTGMKGAENNGMIHVVQRGDNLTSIARKHGTTVPAIKSANNMRSDMIRVNDRLKIPASGNGATNQPGR